MIIRNCISLLEELSEIESKIKGQEILLKELDLNWDEQTILLNLIKSQHQKT